MNPYLRPIIVGCFFASFCFSGSGCDKKPAPASLIDEDQVIYEIQLPVIKYLESKLIDVGRNIEQLENEKNPAPEKQNDLIFAKEEKAFLEQMRQVALYINSNSPVSFRQITQLYLQKEKISYAKRRHGKKASHFDQLFSRLLDPKENWSSLPLDKIKASYEQKIKSITGKEIYYNRDAGLALLMLEGDDEGKLVSQCFFGTIFGQLVLRNLYSGQKFREKNFVVIMETGHALLGEVISTNHGGYELNGVETTVEDEGLVAYGQTKDINHPLVVVNADDFLLLDLFKDYFDEQLDHDTQSTAYPQSVALADKLAEKTMERYQFNLATTYAIAKNVQKGSAEKDTTPAHAFHVHSISPFGFGYVEVPGGTQRRNKRSAIGYDHGKSLKFTPNINVLPDPFFNQKNEEQKMVEGVRELIYENSTGAYLLTKSGVSSTIQIPDIKSLLTNRWQWSIRIPITEDQSRESLTITNQCLQKKMQITIHFRLFGDIKVFISCAIKDFELLIAFNLDVFQQELAELIDNSPFSELPMPLNMHSVHLPEPIYRLLFSSHRGRDLPKLELKGTMILEDSGP